MNILNKIYGPVDKVRNLRLVETGEEFELMNSIQVKDLAEKLINNIEIQKVQNIVVSESGATPLIRICKEEAEKRKINLKWYKFKTPRKNEISLFEMIKFYLSKEEQEQIICIKNNKEKRITFLKKYCENIDLDKYLPLEKVNIETVLGSLNTNSYDFESLDLVLNGTELYDVFSKPFLFFDEYVLSGTILRNFDFYANLICKKANYKLGAYMIFSNNLKQYHNIAFSIYTQETKLQAYKNGAYPYEDRIDLVGYVYLIDKDNYKKIYIKDLIKKCKNKENELEELIYSIEKFIEQQDILNKLKQKCKIEHLKDFFNREDIIRYVFKSFENNIEFEKNSIYNRFVDECFELYSPIWIPMPKEYHYDYWKTFVRIQDEFNTFIADKMKNYENIREYFIVELAKVMSKNEIN